MGALDTLVETESLLDICCLFISGSVCLGSVIIIWVSFFNQMLYIFT